VFPDSKTCETFEQPPKDFHSRLDVAGVFCTHEGRFLLLQRASNCYQPHTWGLPAGKLEKGESPLTGAVRELQEESGITSNPHTLFDLGCVYVRLPGFDYTTHWFHLPLATKPVVTLTEQEHQAHRWVSFKEARELPLILGAEAVFQLYERHSCKQDYQT